MKHTSTLWLTAFFICISVFHTRAQQVPNGGFEDWIDEYTPVGWITSSMAQGFHPLSERRDTIIKRNGNSSIRIEYSSFPFSGYISLGDQIPWGYPNDTVLGIPFPFRPDTLFFSYYYQASDPGVAGEVNIVIRRAGETDSILDFSWPLDPTNGQWVDMVIPLTDHYFSGRIPGRLVLSYRATQSPPFVGTTYILNIDDIRFSNNRQINSELTGKAFIDVNQNQIFDAGDAPIPNVPLRVNGQPAALTDLNGDYYMLTDTGMQVIIPVLPANMAGGTFSPDSIMYHVDSLGIIVAGNDFAIVPPAGFCDGVVSVVAVNPPPRPGFANELDVRFGNIYSVNPVSQQLTLRYDSLQTYLSATPAPASVDPLNHTLTWNLSNIAAGDSWLAAVSFQTPVTAALGTVLRLSVDISGSTCQALNATSTNQEVVVVGSYDPNDKSVSPAGVNPGGRVLPSTDFTYTVRFQNTGTYMAENVRITDTLSNHLDISTLKILAASHDYKVEINGREIVFRFDGINLPDSNSNEPLSHGYVQYAVKPAQTFVQNTVITNRADIYFDFNEPILTNTTVSTADNFVGLHEVSRSINFEVYPNPVSDGALQLITEVSLIGSHYHLTDALGRVLHTAKITGQQTMIDMQPLSGGIYFIRIGNQAKRIVRL